MPFIHLSVPASFDFNFVSKFKSDCSLKENKSNQKVQDGFGVLAM